MDCAQARELLHHSLDGSAASSALRDHLSHCFDCRSQLADLRHTTNVLGTLTTVAAPSSILSAVMAAVQQQNLARPSRSWWHRAATLVATAAAFIGLAFIMQAGPVLETTSAQDVSTTTAGDDVAMTVDGSYPDDPAMSSIAAVTADPVGFTQDLPLQVEDTGTLLLGLCFFFISGAAILVRLLAPDSQRATSGPVRLR